MKLQPVKYIPGRLHTIPVSSKQDSECITPVLLLFLNTTAAFIATLLIFSFGAKIQKPSMLRCIYFECLVPFVFISSVFVE